MRRRARSRRSIAAFYGISIGVVIGLCCMTWNCAMWVDGAAPDAVLTAMGIAGFLLATMAVLREERRSRPASAEVAADRSPRDGAPR